ncbi:hypothetical protein [Mycoplasma parvum]|uniref:Uncharacterized protein n=1 Tax=Mycoplasma parvum str. Indiana TaxID=1403316 RepID=U5NCT0_9MOLU|nr:hypothetical protein [Mycoplasma parvum]AGX89237.1 hypothetical protein PRV_02505 [Mycoplasma parvum str. Indiana]
MTVGSSIGGGITFWVPSSSEVNAHTIYLYNKRGVSEVLKIGKKEGNDRNNFFNFESLLRVGDKYWEHQSSNYTSGRNTSWRISGDENKSSQHWNSMHHKNKMLHKGDENFSGSIKFYLSGFKCEDLKDEVLKNSSQEVSDYEQVNKAIALNC